VFPSRLLVSYETRLSFQLFLVTSCYNLFSMQTLFICAPYITVDSDEMKVVIELVKSRHEKQVRRKEMRYAATKR